MGEKEYIVMVVQGLKQKHTKKPTKSEVKEFTKGKAVALIILSCVGALFAISTLTAIGKGNASGVGLATIVVSVVITSLVFPSFLKDRTRKSIVYIFIAGILVLSSIIAIIADPIALNKRCSKFTTLDEYNNAPLRETSGCNIRAELEAKANEEKARQQEKKNREREEAKNACSAKELDWNEYEERCNTEEEQKISNMRNECSTKKFNWNYEANRCNNDEEQEQYEQKLAEEKAKQEEKNKQEEERKNQDSVQPSTSNSNNKPSINDIADACWSYGQKAGLHLTDYASTEIAQDGSYYRILMWHSDKSVWKCWYNPADGDVFIEKTKDNR